MSLLSNSLKVMSVFLLAAMLFSIPSVPRATGSAYVASDYATAAMQAGSVPTLVSASLLRGDGSQFAIYSGSEALLTFSSSVVISNGLASGLSGPSLYPGSNPDYSPTGATTSVAAETPVAEGGNPSGSNGNDVATLEMVMTVPTNDTTLNFSWSFCTDEVQGSSWTDYFTAVIQNEGFGQNVALLPNGEYVTQPNAVAYSNNPDITPPNPDNVQFNACTAIQTTSVNVASLAGQDLTVDFTVGDGEDNEVNSAVILSNVGFGVPAPTIVHYYPPVSWVNANVTVFAPYSSQMILLQANVAVNGKTLSSSFYEGAVAQFGVLYNGTYGYMGYYQALFCPIVGPVHGSNITIGISYNGLMASETVPIPAPGTHAMLNFTMTSPT